jgi:hypothetical protein
MAYSFLGLNDGWFGNNFEEYMLLGYIGDRERFQKELESKSLFSKIMQNILPELKISTLIKQLIGFELLANQGTNVFEKIYDTLEDEKNRKTITEHLKSIYKKGRASGRYFENIEKGYTKTTLSRADKNKLEGKLITVEGNLIHRTSVSQYSTIVERQFSRATFEWILSDFPPQGLTTKNEWFEGQVLILSEDKGFTKAFGDYLPFSLPISWYPFVRVTGYYSSSKQNINGFPSLSIVLTEYRPPKNLNAVLPSIKSFLKSELNHKIWLENCENFELFSYLIPILFQKANLTPDLAESDLSNLLKQYKAELGTNMPSKLIPFYDNLP